MFRELAWVWVHSGHGDSLRKSKITPQHNDALAKKRAELELETLPQSAAAWEIEDRAQVSRFHEIRYNWFDFWKIQKTITIDRRG